MDREYISTKGIVLKTAVFSESSMMLTVFTENLGIVSVCAKGIKKSGSKLKAASNLFAYGTFELVKSQTDGYILTGAEISESFLSIGSEIEGYMISCELAKKVLNELEPETEDIDTLRLLLNSIYYLSKGTKSIKFIHTAFLVRFAFIQGYMPLSEEIPDILCIKISDASKKALSFMLSCDIGDIFRMNVPDNTINEIYDIYVALEKEFD